MYDLNKRKYVNLPYSNNPQICIRYKLETEQQNIVNMLFSNKQTKSLNTQKDSDVYYLSQCGNTNVIHQTFVLLKNKMG